MLSSWPLMTTDVTVASNILVCVKLWGVFSEFNVWSTFQLSHCSAVFNLLFTEKKRSSIWHLCHHWWHSQLSLRQLTVPPVTAKLSNWRSFVFSVVLDSVIKRPVISVNEIYSLQHFSNDHMTLKTLCHCINFKYIYCLCRCVTYIYIAIALVCFYVY